MVEAALNSYGDVFSRLLESARKLRMILQTGSTTVKGRTVSGHPKCSRDFAH